MNIFEALRADHDKQRNVLKQLTQTSGDTNRRDELFQSIKHELQIHADAEERHFYIPLIKQDMTQDHARHGIAEHHEIDELVKKLETLDYDNTAWLGYAKDLKKKVEHHLEEEEHTYFQLAGKVLTDNQKKELAEKYINHMKTSK